MPVPEKHAERDITPKDRGDAIPIAMTLQRVRLILVEGRKGNNIGRIEMLGVMTIPMQVQLGLVKINWHYDELRFSLKGVVCDPQAGGCNIVIPLLMPEDAMGLDGVPLSLSELRQLIQKYDPGMKVTKVEG